MGISVCQGRGRTSSNALVSINQALELVYSSHKPCDADEADNLADSEHMPQSMRRGSNGASEDLVCWALDIGKSCRHCQKSGAIPTRREPGDDGDGV
jgi:hypothetical protein